MRITTLGTEIQRSPKFYWLPWINTNLEDVDVYSDHFWLEHTWFGWLFWQGRRVRVLN